MALEIINLDDLQVLEEPIAPDGSCGWSCGCS